MRECPKGKQNIQGKESQLSCTQEFKINTRIRANMEEFNAAAYCLKVPVKESCKSSSFFMDCLKSLHLKAVIQEYSGTWSEECLDTITQPTERDGCLHGQFIQCSGNSGHDPDHNRYLSMFNSGGESFINHSLDLTYLNPA